MPRGAVGTVVGDGAASASDLPQVRSSGQRLPRHITVMDTVIQPTVMGTVIQPTVMGTVIQPTVMDTVIQPTDMATATPHPSATDTVMDHIGVMDTPLTVSIGPFIPLLQSDIPTKKRQPRCARLAA